MFTVFTTGEDWEDTVDISPASITVTQPATLTGGLFQVESAPIQVVNRGVVQEENVMRLRYSSPVPYRQGCTVSYWFPTMFYNADDILKIQVGPLLAQTTETYAHSTKGAATEGGLPVAGRFTVKEEEDGEYKSITFNSCSGFRSQDLPEQSRIYGLSQPMSTEPTTSVKVYITDATGNIVSELESDVTFTPITGEIAFGPATIDPTTVSAPGLVSMSITPAHDLSPLTAPSLTI